MGKRQKRKKSANNNRPTMLSILVASDMVGVIIGRGGSTIKEIMEQTSARINVNKNDIVGCSEKVITIYGIPESCTLACRKILEVMLQKATYSNESHTILRILIYDILNGLMNGEEDITIKNIMSETKTKINITSDTNITIDNINYKAIYIHTVEGSIENVSKAESQISAKFRQSFEKCLQPTIDINSEIGLTHFWSGGPGATPVIRNRQTEFLLCILVHSEVISIIICRGGSTVKEIMEQTSVKISVYKNNIFGSLEKPIAIYGTPENCTNACRMILEVLQQKVTYTNESNILRILIHDNLIGLIIGEEGNTIRNIMSETETKINVTRNIDITIDDINYKSVCTVEGSIENISKAESLISAKLRQSFEKYLQQVVGCQLNIDPVIEMRNFSEIGFPHFSYGGTEATPIITNRQTEYLLCILVHSDMVYAIIGTRGSTIKKITQQTSAWIHVQPKGNFVGQAIIIKGNPENCTNACFKILEVLQQKATNTRSRSAPGSSDVILKILIPDNLIGIIIEEEGNTIWKIMSETETKINVSSTTDMTIGSFNYKSICKIEGSIENVSKAEVQISAKLRQSIEHFIQSMDIKAKPALGMRNLCEIEHIKVLHVVSKTISTIEKREFTLRILVPKNMIPIIIGKLGSTIKEITQQTNAKIHVNQTDGDDSTEKAITIKGIPENCTNACRKILEVMQQKATYYNKSVVILKILVHNNQIDVINGEEGNNIRKIMSETDTKIVEPSITDITIDGFNNERIFTIEGSVENVSKAEAQISAKIRLCFENISHYKLIRVVKPEMINKKYKLIIVGHSNVGKSSIIKRFCGGNIYQFIKPTIGMDIQQIFVGFNNETIHLEIRDIAGTENYQSLATSYRGAHGIFIVYDITDFSSSLKLNGWIKDIQTLSDPHSVKMLIGSKCDDIANRKLSIKEGQRIAGVYKIPFFEVSSKTNINIDKLFYLMISKIHEFHQQTTNINIENYKLKIVEPETTDKKYKLIIVGHLNVGKSTIIYRFCKGVYKETVATTIGQDFHEIFVRFENETIQLNIWDTAGTEKHQSLTRSYYRGAHGIFIVYDITDVNALSKLQNWINDVKVFSDPDAVKILIGSKCDDTSNRKISIEEGQDIAKALTIPFFEVSSKTNVNINNLFFKMISTINDIRNQPTDIKKNLNHIADVTDKQSIESDKKPNTIQIQCPKMEKKVADVPNINFDDREHYKLIRLKPQETNNKFKLIIVGHSYTGKSAIINRITKGVYEDTISTLGMDFHETFVRFKNKAIQLTIWDTAGTENYRSLAQSYYRGAHGIFIVYDITDVNALSKLQNWINDVKVFSDPDAVKILIGSKCDDTSNRKISIEEGQDIAKALTIPFFEVSSKTNVNINNLFFKMISTINDIRNQPTDIKKNLNHIADVTDKQSIESDKKPNTIQIQCPKMEKKVADVPNINFDDREHYKLIRLKLQETNNKFKLIIVGHSYTGKSAIINRITKGVYEDTISTVGMDFYETFVRFKNKAIQLTIWDTAGTEKYRSLAQSYYRGAHGIFIVYDITDVNALSNLKNWINDVKVFSDPDAVKILIGSKCDDTSNRKISIEAGQDIAKALTIPFFEVSSKTNMNIDKLFYTMISKINENQAQPTKVQDLEHTSYIRVEKPPSDSEKSNKSSKGCC